MKKYKDYNQVWTSTLATILAVITLGWFAYSNLDNKIDKLSSNVMELSSDIATIKERLLHITPTFQKMTESITESIVE